MNKNQIRLKTPINLALIKYWGKLETQYNLPLNSNFSITISRQNIFTEILINFQDEQQDTFKLLDQNDNIIEDKLPKKFTLIKTFFQNYLKSQNKDAQFYVNIISKNNFPTQAGMASSASGFCSLVLGVARLLNYFEENNDELNEDVLQNIVKWFKEKNTQKMQKVFLLTILLRQCSLSSMRSIFLTPTINIGPDMLINNIQLEQIKEQQKISDIYLKENIHLFQKQKVNDDYLQKTTRKYFQDKIYDIEKLIQQTQAYTFLNYDNFFSQITILVIVVKKEKKKVASTNGMIQSTLTSELLPQRVNQVPIRIKNIIQYIESNNYEQFFELVMQDSNQFHAICQESYPPLFYLNDISKEIINIVHEFNEKNGVCSGYSFDAGPNAFILIKNEKVQKMKEKLKKYENKLIETRIESMQIQ